MNGALHAGADGAGGAKGTRTAGGDRCAVRALSFVGTCTPVVPIDIQTLMGCNAAMTAAVFGGQVVVAIHGTVQNNTHQLLAFCLPPLLFLYPHFGIRPIMCHCSRPSCI